LYVTDGAINATVPKDEPLDELTPERAFELLAIRRERLGLEPGQPAPKASKAGRRSTAPARTVKKGGTRKKAE
jgi:DNA topoisomerase-1